MPHWRRLKTSDWDHKLIRKMFIETAAHLRSSHFLVDFWTIWFVFETRIVASCWPFERMYVQCISFIFSAWRVHQTLYTVFVCTHWQLYCDCVDIWLNRRSTRRSIQGIFFDFLLESCSKFQPHSFQWTLHTRWEIFGHNGFSCHNKRGNLGWSSSEIL